jgi:hypothetical protein
MRRRLLWIPLALAAAISLAWLIFTYIPSCTDPSGCIYLRPGDPILIDVEVLSSGIDRPVSQEIYQAISLSVDNLPPIGNHRFSVRPFYSTCLPETPSQSAIDLSAAMDAPAALGPSCSIAADDFVTRVARSGKLIISPNQYRIRSYSGGLWFSPNLPAFEKNAAALLATLQYKNWVVAASTDPYSQQTASELCSILTDEYHKPCQPIDANSPEAHRPDGMIIVQMQPSADMIQMPDLFQDLPRVLFSLDYPPITSNETPALYWVGPHTWNQGQNFITQYTNKYQSAPVYLASFATQDALPLLADAIQKSKIDWINGSLMIPQSVFNKYALESSQSTNGLFNPACNTGKCSALSLALYQLVENKYILANP